MYLSDILMVHHGGCSRGSVGVRNIRTPGRKFTGVGVDRRKETKALRVLDYPPEPHGAADRIQSAKGSGEVKLVLPGAGVFLEHTVPEGGEFMDKVFLCKIQNIQRTLFYQAIFINIPITL